MPSFISAIHILSDAHIRLLLYWCNLLLSRNPLKTPLLWAVWGRFGGGLGLSARLRAEGSRCDLIRPISNAGIISLQLNASSESSAEMIYVNHCHSLRCPLLFNATIFLQPYPLYF